MKIIEDIKEYNKNYSTFDYATEREVLEYILYILKNSKKITDSLPKIEFNNQVFAGDIYSNNIILQLISCIINCEYIYVINIGQCIYGVGTARLGFTKKVSISLGKIIEKNIKKLIQTSLIENIYNLNDEIYKNNIDLYIEINSYLTIG